MIVETVTLSPYQNATLTSICISNTNELKLSPRPAVIVCPGGGYRFLSDREAEPIALRFLAAGYQTFILRYTIKEEARNLAPLRQSAMAVKYVRDHASDYNVDPEKVFICGFSAGGHLAASCGILWNMDELADIRADRPEGYTRPTGMILCYPVITAGEFAHQGSIRCVTGSEEPTEEERARFSLEKHVDPTTPPAFIWHTFADASVPVQNSLFLAEAMATNAVPCEMHIYPKGHHGLSLCNEITASEKESNINPHAEGWMDLAIRWIRDFG